MEGFKKIIAAIGLITSPAQAQEVQQAPRETIVGVKAANFDDPAAQFQSPSEPFEQSNDPTQNLPIARPEGPERDISLPFGLRPEEESLRHGVPGLRHVQAGIVESAHGDDMLGARFSTKKEED